MARVGEPAKSKAKKESAPEHARPLCKWFKQGGSCEQIIKNPRVTKEKYVNHCHNVPVLARPWFVCVGGVCVTVLGIVPQGLTRSRM